MFVSKSDAAKWPSIVLNIFGFPVKALATAARGVLVLPAVFCALVLFVDNEDPHPILVV
jgi:hypothetical protein